MRRLHQVADIATALLERNTLGRHLVLVSYCKNVTVDLTYDGLLEFQFISVHAWKCRSLSV